jgi:MFS family permease
MLGGAAAGLAVGWNVANVGALAGTVSDAYGVGLGAVGLLTTVLFVVHIGVQLPAGRLVDARGARRIGLVALAVIAVANALATVAPDLGIGLTARALAGVGTAFAFIAGSDYVRANVGTPFAQGMFGGVNLAAGGIGLAVVPAVAGPLGWRAPFASAALVALVALAVLAAGPRDPRRVAAPVRRSRGAPGGFHDLGRLAVLHSASFGLNVVVGNWVVLLVSRGEHVSDRVAGLIGALTLVAGIVSRPLGGWIARVRPSAVRPAVAASLAVGAIGTAALAASGRLWRSAAGALAIGLAAGIPFAPAFSGAAHVRPDAPGHAVAFVNASAGIVILAGTPLLGLAFGLPGDGRIGFAAAAALWAAALLVLPSRAQLGVSDRPGK